MGRLSEAELELVPGGTLMTATPEERRALALMLARHMINNIQPDLEVAPIARPRVASLLRSARQRAYE